MSHLYSSIYSPRFFFSLFSSLFVIGSVHFALGRTTSWQEWVLHIILSVLGMGVTWQWWQQQKELRRYHLSLQEQKHQQTAIIELQEQQQQWQAEKSLLLAEREALTVQLQQRQTELEALGHEWQIKWESALNAEKLRQQEIKAAFELEYAALRESLTSAHSQNSQELQTKIDLITAENQALLDEYQHEVEQQEQELQRLRFENEQIKYQLQETESHELELQQRLKKSPTPTEAYRLRIQCAEDLGLPAKIYEQIFSRILHLQTEPRPASVEKVKKYRHQYPNLYRLRAGDYRVYYLVDDSQREVQVVMVDIKDGDKTTDERLGRRL